MRKLILTIAILLLPLGSAFADKNVLLEWDSVIGSISVETGKPYPAINTYKIHITSITPKYPIDRDYVYVGYDNWCNVSVPNDTTNICFCVTINDCQFASQYRCLQLVGESPIDSVQVKLIP